MEKYETLSYSETCNTLGGGISAKQCAIAVGAGIAGGAWKGGATGTIFGGVVGTAGGAFVGAHVGAIGGSLVCIGGLLG